MNCHYVQIASNLSLTARQYGEVVLPDASTGQGPGTPSTRGQKVVTVQGGYGTCFCRHGTKFIACRRGRGTKFLSGRELVPVQKFDKWALAQCRDAIYLEARNLSWCSYLIACRCAYPGA